MKTLPLCLAAIGFWLVGFAPAGAADLVPGGWLQPPPAPAVHSPPPAEPPAPQRPLHPPAAARVRTPHHVARHPAPPARPAPEPDGKVRF